jgi:hypothetical protein
MMSGVAMRSAGTYPHSGAGYLLLGGANSSSGYAYQEITIPKRSSPNLSFWLNVTSSDMSATPKDKLFIEVCNRSGKVIRTLATFSHLDHSAPGDYRLQGDYNLAAFAVKTVRIQFRTITDSSSVTSFRIDDVSAR